ncbi:MAG: GNAT family N-acetyltransferase [Brooklawnia sp.]|jgi:GNAT superfamily N-acetyltransferase
MRGQYHIKQAASPGEIEAGVRVNALAWEQSYRGLLADEVIAARASEQAMARRLQEWLQSAVDGTHFWIALDRNDGHAVGIANACPARDADAPVPLELTMLYVLDEVKGSGLADALLHTAIGDAPAYLWTLSGYERAIGFYRRHGFSLDGASRAAEYLVNPETVRPPTQLRMVRPG